MLLPSHLHDRPDSFDRIEVRALWREKESGDSALKVEESGHSERPMNRMVLLPQLQMAPMMVILLPPLQIPSIVVMLHHMVSQVVPAVAKRYRMKRRK